jgi:hypothetical protein
MAPAVLPIIDGSRKGEMRFTPLLNKMSQLRSTESSPPTPEPTSTPNRFESTVFGSSLPSASADFAAAIAKWEYRSCRLATFLSQYWNTSKSFTSDAIVVCGIGRGGGG